MIDIISEYFNLQQEIYDHFGYVEDWVVIPISDDRRYYWRIDDNTVKFADSEPELYDELGNYYEHEIYKQRFLPKWVYRASDYTMICVDTHVDGNKFMSIFDNPKERTLADQNEQA